MREIPTIAELQSTLKDDFKNKLNLSDSDLKYVLNAFSIVLASQIKLNYLYLSDIQNNIFPDTADSEANGGTLERLGRIYLNRNPKPATPGVFELSVTGTAGGFLRSGLTFKSNEDAKNASKLYVLDAEYTLTGSNDLIEVRSLGGGSEFDLNVSDELTITEPIIGVDSTVSVFSVVSNPINSEDLETYRQAILDAIQLEPQGGSKTDYRLWASDAQGVRKVYPYVKNDNAGVVQIFVEATESDSTDGLGTPTTTILNDVESVIEFDPDTTKPLNERGRRPIQAIIEVLGITPIPVDVTIINLNDDSTAVRNAIISNIEEYLKGIRPYISGADLPRDKDDILYSGRVQSIVTDVLESSNFYDDFSIDVNGVTVSSYQFNLGFIPYLRNTNFS